eukprot:6491164-Amphidinium_carterae.4
MDLGYLPWSNKGKGKDSKGKGHKGDKGKGDTNSWWEHFAGYCGKCGLWGHKRKNCRRQVNAVEEAQPPTEVGHLSALWPSLRVFHLDISI